MSGIANVRTFRKAIHEVKVGSTVYVNSINL